MRGANWNPAVSGSALRLTRPTRTTTTTKRTNCRRPVWAGKLKVRTCSRSPTAIEAPKATGNDTIPPIIAATRPRSRVSGPMATRSVEVESVAMRITARADRNPAIVQHAGGHHLGVDPGQAGQVRVGHRGPHRLPEPGPVEQPPQPERRHRDGDDGQELGAAHGDPGPDVPLPVDGAGEGRLQRPRSGSWAGPG